MKKSPIRILIVLLLVLILALSPVAFAENYTAGTMRLLHYEGQVEILDAAGAPRFLMENVRFDSGETLVTGADGVAAVSLDTDRIVTLDVNSRAVFEAQSNAMKLTLTEGALLLDVQRKLDTGETLDIQTSTMTVGIRGTIVYLTQEPGDENDTVRNTLGVLEGTAEVTYVNRNGTRQTVQVSRGQVATLEGTSVSEPVADVRVEALTRDAVPAFVTHLPDGIPATVQRVEESLGRLEGGEVNNAFPADGDWKWEDAVTLVAQSASKLYDGEPLSRPADSLVYGLPAQFTIRVDAAGAQTDAGESANTVASYVIYNAVGEDVTSHFNNIQKVDGQLVVDPAPLTVWTGSAEKTYDGTPLTNPAAGVTAYPGYEKTVTPWRNLSYVQTTTSGGEVLLGLCGATWVHGTNPLTGETREIVLRAGEKLTVVLNDQGGGQSIDFVVEKMAEKEIPEEALRLYARNPELLAQACRDALWSEQALAKRIAQLTAEEGSQRSQRGLSLSEEEAERLMPDCTNVRITVDTEITSYNERALGSEEAHFTPVSVPEDIRVTATGSRTEVGVSTNTYTIDWGASKPGNYALNEQLGTLTVNPAPSTYDDAIRFTAASAEKDYDGSPLTADSYTVTGLPKGFSAKAEVSGSQTDAGTGRNSISSYAIYDADGQDVTERCVNVTTANGSLTVTPAEATVTTGSADKAYDGTPLTSGEASITGLVAGESAAVTATGSITDVGTADNTYTIDWSGAKSGNYTITESLGTLEVTPNDEEITFTASSASKVYDGTPLSVAIEVAPAADIPGPGGSGAVITAPMFGGGGADVTITVTGLPEGLSFTAKASASQISVGSCSYAITDLAILDGDGKDVTAFFTNVKTVDGTLTIEPAELTVTTVSASKEYDGTPLTGGEASITDLVEGETAAVTATGAITDVGTAENSYTIDWGETDPGNYVLTENLGTLEVTPLAVSFDLGGYTAEYCGDVLLPDGLSSDKATLTEIDVVTDDTEREIGVEGTFSLPGGQLVLTVNGYEDAGSYTLSPELQFLSGKAENYTISYTNTDMTIEPMEVTVRLHDGSELPYTGLEQLGNFSASNSEFDIGYLLDGDRGIVWGGDRIHVIVTGGGADAGEYTLACTFDAEDAAKVENYHFTVTDTAMTIVPAELTVRTPSASRLYSGEELRASPAELIGLVSADAGKVTVTCTGTITEVGTVPNGYSINWGEVNSQNYTLTEELGTLEVFDNDIPITLRSSSAEKVYDGTALTTSEVTVEGMPEGYLCEAFATGSQTDAGSSPNTISYTIIDPDGMNVTTAFTNVTLEEGTLTVEPLEVSIQVGETTQYGYYKMSGNFVQPVLTYQNGSHAGETVYPVSGSSGSDVSYSDYTLCTGEELHLTVNGFDRSKDAGSYPVTASCSFSGSAANYSVSYTNMTFVVEKRSVTIDLGGGTLSYDGQEHGAQPVVTDSGDASCTLDSPMTKQWRLMWSWGDITSFVVTTSGTKVGDYTLSPMSIEGAGNFELQFTNTALTIQPVALTITTESADKTYDGAALTASLNVTGVVPADQSQITVTATGSQTDAGTAVNSYSISWGSVYSGNYILTEKLGTLQVNPAPLTVSTGSGSKPFDNTPLTNSEANLSGLVMGETATVAATGSQTAVGTSANTYAITWGSAKSGNYTIVENLGTLEVTEGVSIDPLSAAVFSGTAEPEAAPPEPAAEPTSEPAEEPAAEPLDQPAGEPTAEPAAGTDEPAGESADAPPAAAGEEDPEPVPGEPGE